MIAFTTLVRRTATALSAIAALTATGVATAQTIMLNGASGNNCTYSSMSVTPAGNFTVTCTSTTSPGIFTLSAVTSLSTSSTSTSTQIRVIRTGGTAGAADVPFTATGACSASASTASPISFADGDGVAKSIIVDTAATAGTCQVALQAPSVGTLGTVAQTTKIIQVVDPDAPVVFGFAADTSNAAVGGANTKIIVTRTGGSNNAWSVPVSLSGSLTLSGNIITGAGAIAPATLNFAANSSQAELTFDPPNATPGSPPLPGTLVIGLGTPTTTASTSQTASISATDRTHTLTLTGPAVGCPAEQTAAVDLGGSGKLTLTRLTSGVVGTFILPTLTSTRTSSGNFKLSETTSSFPIAPWSYEIHINKCRGLVQPSAGDKCYAVSGNKTLFSMVWFGKLGAAPYNSPAAISQKYCYAPASEGPWYVNVRYNYTSCTTAPCGWHAQWQNYAY